MFENKPQNIALVKVFCSYEAAQKRFEERNRSRDIAQHRTERSFAQHYDKVSKNGRYNVIYGDKDHDYEIDTTDISPEEGAEQILSHLVENGKCSFDNACSKNNSRYRKH